MNTIYLLLGGNTGNRIQNIDTAIGLLQQRVGSIIRHSSVYETAAWGNTSQPDFLNQVVVAETGLDAGACLRQILNIETEMGRIRNKKNDPRTIDIDILFFNDDVIHEPHLTVPHPQIQNRRFVLAPMSEIAPDLVHPVLKRPIRELLSACQDKLEVRLVSDL